MRVLGDGEGVDSVVSGGLGLGLVRGKGRGSAMDGGTWGHGRGI